MVPNLDLNLLTSIIIAGCEDMKDMVGNGSSWQAFAQYCNTQRGQTNSSGQASNDAFSSTPSLRSDVRVVGSIDECDDTKDGGTLNLPCLVCGPLLVSYSH